MDVAIILIVYSIDLTTLQINNLIHITTLVT